MDTILSSAFYFILSFGVLITFHEFGHYWVAKKVGVKVLRFSIGYGRPLWRKQRGPDQTEYVIAALPLGGYVKMLDEREGEVDPAEVHRAFNRQKLGHRAAIVAAGPIFNFLLAIVAYWLVFMIGVTGIKPIVGLVQEGSVAQASGVVPGDQIVSVGGIETSSWSSVFMAMIEKSLAEGEVDVRVITEQGEQNSRMMDLSHLAAKLDQGNLLALVGITPKDMAIPAILGTIESGSPAERAGLLPGDELLVADGKEIAEWMSWVELVRSKPGVAINVEYLRANVKQTAVLTPEVVDGGNGKMIGRIGAGVKYDPEAASEFIIVERFGIFESVAKAVEKTWDVSVLTLKMLYNMLFGEISLKNLSGPLSIAQYAGDSASIGLVAFLTFIAVVSVSLGVLNLLPIPILDGGHLVFYFVEFVKGSPVSQETELKAQHIGIVILLIAMVFAFYNDLTRIFG